MRSPLSRTFALLSIAALLASGCTHPRSAQEIAAAGNLTAANQQASQSKLKKPVAPSNSAVIGRVAWASRVESIGVVHLTVPPLPAGTILLARTGDLTPDAIMQTTNTVSGRTQGVTLINGVPNTNDQVVQPGPEYSGMIKDNLNTNNQRLAKQSFQGAGTADPMVFPGQN
jgi:hypothetical protein